MSIKLSAQLDLQGHVACKPTTFAKKRDKKRKKRDATLLIGVR